MEKNYEKLVKKINELNYHYYTLDNPISSDKEYDILYDELVKLEKENPNLITPDSPTQRVGYEVLSKFEKKEHTVPLYSLDKAQDKERVRKFDSDIRKVLGDNVSYTVELKIDGLSNLISYNNGLLNEGRTRGTGKIGEVVTSQIKTIKSIPVGISYKKPIEIQGEIFMPINKFNDYNNKMTEKFHNAIKELGNEPSEEDVTSLQNKFPVLKNPRNGASGALRNLDPKVTASRPLDAFFYNVPYVEGIEFQTQEELMNFLKEQGFKISPHFSVCKNIEEVLVKLDEINEIRPTLNFDIDGVVIKLNEIQKRDEVGYTAKFPKWAIAYKFEAIEETTILKKVTFQVGRTGKITPLAHLEPIDFGGVTVTKATLNNMDDIQRKGVKIGSEVFVRRSNDVIPEIMGIVEGSDGKDIEAPTHCPDCQTELLQDGVHLFCPNNESCPSQLIGKFVHFASREAMNIDTFSDKTAEQLFENNLIHSLTDLYKLDIEDLLQLERFGKRKAEKLLAAIENSKKNTLSSFLYGLGIKHVGKGTVERLLRHYNSLEDISNATIEELINIEDIGETVAESIVSYFNEEKNLDIISELKSLGVEMKHETKELSSNKLENLTLVITGTMTRPRKEIEAYIKENGGKTSSSVSKKTDYVVVGSDAGSKLEKAQKLGVKILSEDELYKL